MQKIRVAVLRGGLSNEYQASLWTGASILEHLDRKRFDPLDIIISKNGEWLYNGKVYVPESILSAVDVVCIALHGEYGEDGTIQRLIERHGVPYTGSRPFPSRIGMNKILTKDFLKQTDITVAPHVVVSSESLHDVGRIAENITDMFGPQYIIKPVSSGSSIGTMMVKNPAVLPQALTDALSKYDEVMVEARIPGREATCGVIERFRDTPLYALPPIEIIPPPYADFFSEDINYNGEAEEICPAQFSRSIKNELERVAVLVHQTLNLSQYSRSDFIVSEGTVYFLEVNTLPGLTKQSLFPKAIEAIGATYSDFLTHLLMDALTNCKFR